MTFFPSETDFDPRYNPYLELVWKETYDFVKKIQHDEQPSIPQESAVEPAVLTEIYRFENYFEAKVEKEACILLQREMEKFCFAPNPEWEVEPAMHATYAIALLVGIPVGLRNICAQSGHQPLLQYHQLNLWLKNNLAAICPYVGPGSQDGGS